MQVEKKRVSALVCERIRLLAADKGLTNLDLAKKADISYRTVYSVMKGSASLQDRIVSKFAAALGVSTAYLLTGEAGKQQPLIVEREEIPHRNTNQRTNGPCTVDQAMKTLAIQFGIPAEEILKMITAWIVKQNHREDIPE